MLKSTKASAYTAKAINKDSNRSKFELFRESYKKPLQLPFVHLSLVLLYA